MNSINATLMSERQTLPVASLSVASKRRWLIALLGLAFLFALLIVSSRFLQNPLRFPVSHVDVMGTMDYADRSVLMAEIKPYTLQGFYGLDIDRLRQTIEARPWIASAKVSRIWPGRISIEVEEHEPAARWNDDHLISKKLVLFKPHQLNKQSADYAQWREVFRPLPQVLGAHGRHVALLDAYRAHDQQLAAFDLSLSLLDEDDRLSQTLVLSNGVQVHLGREQRELRMQRFLDVYERIAAEATAEADAKAGAKATGGPLSFDMRYSNGFSLGLADHLNDTDT